MIWLKKPSMKLFLFLVCLPLLLSPVPNGICTLQHSELQDRWSMLCIYFYLNTKKTQQSLLMTETHSSLHAGSHPIISGSKQLQRHSWLTAGLWQWKKIMLNYRISLKPNLCSHRCEMLTHYMYLDMFVVCFAVDEQPNSFSLIMYHHQHHHHQGWTNSLMQTVSW